MNYFIYTYFVDGVPLYLCRIDGTRFEWTAEAVDAQLAIFNDKPRSTIWYKQAVVNPTNGN